MPVDEPEFRTHFAGLTRPQATAFVADLWRARGWAVDRETDRLVVTATPTTPPKTLAVLTGDAPSDPPTDVDVVVTTGAPEPLDLPRDVDVVAPAEFFQLLKFGVEPDRARRLLADHFEDLPDGVSIATASPPAQSRASDSGAGDGESAHPDGPGDSPEQVPGEPEPATEDHAADEDAVAGETAGPAQAATAAGATASGDQSSTPRRTPTRRTLLLTGGAVVAGFGTAIATGVTTNAQPTVDAPGVTAEGVVDPTALGAAHATGIAERSYSLALDLTISDADESLRSYLSMTLGLAADRSYRTRVATSGEDAPGFLGEPPATAEFWADGDTYLVNHAPAATDSFTEFQPPDGFVGTWKYWAWMIPFGGTLGSRPRDYFETVFEAVPTRLLERQETPDGPRYRVHNDGRALARPSSLNEPGASDVRDVRLAALIDARGVVRSFELDFAAELDGDPVEFSRTVEYSGFGETTVERPDK